MNRASIFLKPGFRRDILVALLLAGLTLAALLSTAPQIGLTWDEPTYIVAAETYPAWFAELIVRPSAALNAEEISKYWTTSHEHPPLSKVWSGFIWLGARHFLDDLTAHRLGNIIIVSVLVMLLYLMVAQEAGSLAGLAAVCALLTMPRFFFHAHLAAIDVPVTAMIFAVIYTFWFGRNRAGLRWTLLLGLVWGLALATKINALFIPPMVLSAWVLIVQRRRYLFARLALMGIIGFGFFILSWPWLYHDLFNRLTAYVGFMTINRLPVEQYYLGHLFAPPPWHFPFVITIMVVPFSILIFAAIGAFALMWRQEDRPLGELLLLGIFVCLAVFTTGLGQVFDNERFMMPVFPYLAALAGTGFARLVPALERLLEKRGIQLRRHQLISILALMTLVPHLLLASDLYPHLLSYYSEAVGGVYGARLLGMETTYWCDTYTEVLPFINAHAGHGDVVWAECLDVVLYYQLHGRLRPDLQIAGGPDAVSVFPGAKLSPESFDEADYVIIQNRQSGFYRAVRTWMNAHKPVYAVPYRRLWLIAVYAN